MEKWAFATSLPPYGLGLSSAEFWYLSHEEYDAKVCCWEKHQEAHFIMLANLRADLHNGQVSRQDGQPWTAQHFGAPAPKQKNPRRKFHRKEILPRLKVAFAGKLVDANGRKMSALDELKGAPLVMRKRS